MIVIINRKGPLSFVIVIVIMVRGGEPLRRDRLASPYHRIAAASLFICGRITARIIIHQESDRAGGATVLIC